MWLLHAWSYFFCYGFRREVRTRSWWCGRLAQILSGRRTRILPLRMKQWVHNTLTPRHNWTPSGTEHSNTLATTTVYHQPICKPAPPQSQLKTAQPDYNNNNDTCQWQLKKWLTNNCIFCNVGIHVQRLNWLVNTKPLARESKCVKDV